MKTETIYIDSLCHCHRIDDGTMTAVETGFFIGKCDAWVEGYCYDASKGYTQIYPWKDYALLETAQSLYEETLVDKERITALEEETVALKEENETLKEEVSMLTECALEMSSIIYA